MARAAAQGPPAAGRRIEPRTRLALLGERGRGPLNSRRPHRFGRTYQRAFSERLKQAKSNNFKRSNFRQSVFFGAQMRSSKKVVEEGSRYW